jgi:hypothetical protein
MVAAARQRLLRTGVQPARIYHEIGLDLSSFELAAVQHVREHADEAQPARAEPGSVDSGRLERLRPTYGRAEQVWPAPAVPVPSTAQAALVPVTPPPVAPPPAAADPGPAANMAASGAPSHQPEAPMLDQWFAMQSPPTSATHVNGDADPGAADRLQELRAQIEYRRSLRRPLQR